jgi:hypothetical protein
MPLEGLLRVSKEVPKDIKGWDQFFRRLNEQIQSDGERVVLNSLATIASRTGTNLDDLLQLISDEGRAENQRFLPTVTFGNVASVQSVEPLTAVAGSTTADVSIAAHTLHTDFGNVAYNSGSVTGLALNTRYYVYVDDPDNEGGAVTYLASTSKPNVPANSGRYFIGSIETPSAGASVANINGATSALPIVLQTTAAHGFISGETVTLASLPGDFGTNLNGNDYLITVVDPTHFSVPPDGSAYAAYTSGGTATRVVPDTGNDVGGGGGGYLP